MFGAGGRAVSTRTFLAPPMLTPTLDITMLFIRDEAYRRAVRSMYETCTTLSNSCLSHL